MASTTADRGSLSTEATAAPIPTVTAGVIEKPGSCAAISPAAAPRNSAGKTGPPRKAPSEIAQALSLSVKTVSTYRTRLMEKMGLQSNSDLTYYALKNKLID